MQQGGNAVLFPGQGAYYAGVLKESRRTYPQIDDVFAEIDAVAAEHLRKTISEKLFGASPPDIKELLRDDPEVLQLAIYGVSVATYRILAAHGLRAGVLVGHSFGEIAALVCSGAFTVKDGAAIVCHRMAALRQSAGPSGYMAALGANVEQAGALVKLAGNGSIAVAGENHASQTVISGAEASMDVVQQLARALQIPLVRLDSPYPFHSPVMAPAVADFAARLGGVEQKPLRTPVFSPILGRQYHDGDVLTQCLADHLIQPVKFAAATRHLYSSGVRVFIEAGALDTLGKLAAKELPDADIVTISCLQPQREAAALSDAIRQLEELGMAHSRDAEMPAEGGDVSFDAFWAARGPRILSYIREEFEAFTTRHVSEAVPIAAPHLTSVKPGPAAVAIDPSSPPPPPQNRVSRETLFREIVDLYAAALEYPEEVFSDEVELEAELGVDSVKQTELFGRVAERYGLPPAPADFRLGDYPTMGKIVTFVFTALSGAADGSGDLVTRAA
ncbi:MAG: acyltransferase domain-containing protein [Chloroflexi bacterium]|nr:acyltransferase domain-containing protein [Chloroflexota bacterium]